MIPTMAASTGAARRPSASPAARPSSTINTFSCTPAPTPSIASSAVPRGESSAFSGCTSISFAPSNVGCFCVETTVPMTLAICTGRLHVPVVDDADDGGIDRRFGGMEGKAGFLAANEEHLFADAGADRIDGDERTSCGLPIRRDRLDEHEFD